MMSDFPYILPGIEPVDLVLTDPPYGETSLKWDEYCTEYMGEPGNTFEAFGATFEIISVDEVRLYEVASLWREEGCKSEDEI
jgi:hypothetical protein